MSPPSMTGSRDPNRLLSRPANGDTRVNMRLKASIRSPAWSADRCWTSWKNWTVKNGTEMSTKPRRKVTAAVAGNSRTLNTPGADRERQPHLRRPPRVAPALHEPVGQCAHPQDRGQLAGQVKVAGGGVG